MGDLGQNHHIWTFLAQNTFFIYLGIKLSTKSGRGIVGKHIRKALLAGIKIFKIFIFRGPGAELPYFGILGPNTFLVLSWCKIVSKNSS